ncbi:2368_t:CDS:2, partial [Gigaspora margarita]
ILSEELIGNNRSDYAIVINKLVEDYNHSLAPYKKEFALSLCFFSQEVLDTIRFLTQEYCLRAKAQQHYISKKFSDQPIYDPQEKKPGWVIYLEFEDITQKQEYAHSFGIAKSGLKVAIENGLVNEFVGLVTRFIKHHTCSNSMQRDILQDLDMEQKNSRPAKWINIEVNNKNVKPILETR